MKRHCKQERHSRRNNSAAHLFECVVRAASHCKQLIARPTEANIAKRSQWAVLHVLLFTADSG